MRNGKREAAEAAEAAEVPLQIAGRSLTIAAGETLRLVSGRSSQAQGAPGENE